MVIIPARGGSKGIPRKNLRSLNGKPLIYYSIKNALSVETYAIDCYVSSEDDEILAISNKFNAKIFRRDSQNSVDKTTLDPVIHEAYEAIKVIEKKDYEIVITLQPTSPLLSPKSIENAIDTLLEKELDTIISGTWDSHLSWIKKEGKFLPNYKKRLNRQELPEIYRETGGFLITRTEFVQPNSRLGGSIEIFPLKQKEAIDIDNYEDWSLCEYYLKRKRIVFAVSGNREIGLGHVYNTLSIANEILNHEIIFLVDKTSELAFTKIKELNHNVHIQQSKNTFTESILEFRPDVVINDRLDTTEGEILALKNHGCLVINFEDLGSGSRKADLVINAMYPEENFMLGHFFGTKYFILRDEFIFTPVKTVINKVRTLLISFGGVDPNNYTARVLKIVKPICDELKIKIVVIAGMGYKNMEDLLAIYNDVKILKNVSSISEQMSTADVVFTSAGRTTFEVAAIGVPTIVLCQNERETTHFFASEENGFYNLGLGSEVSDADIKAAFEKTLPLETRLAMNQRMLESSLRNGKKRVMKLINGLINE